MRLPSHEEATRRARDVRERVMGFAAARADDPLAWSRLPRLARIADLNTTGPYEVPSHPPADEIRRMQQAEAARDGARPKWAESCFLGRGCLLIAYNQNLRSSQAPLHERFAPLRPPSEDITAPAPRMRELAARAVSLGGEFVDWARSESLALPVEPKSIYRGFLRAAGVLGYWEQVIAREAPRVIVVGTTSGARSRLLMHVARGRGIPTVYVPHAPLLSDPLRTDLPIDYVALRGAREADHLGLRGIEADRLDVVGNPSLAPEPMPEVDGSLPTAFAPSAQRRALLGDLVALVDDALGADVAVSPPPELRAIADSTFPPAWRMWEKRTYDLLRAGPPALLQHSSGTALEALSLGIPVIELSFPGKDATYPLIREPHVRFASDSDQLRAAVAGALDDARSPDRRAALVDWARGWAWPTGDDAAQRMVALVERAAADGPRRPVWDAIRTGVGG